MPHYFDDPTVPIPGYKKNDFGYTIGGPVFIPGLYNKNKDKPSSSGRKNGGETVLRSPLRQFKFRPPTSAPEILAMFVLAQIARLIPLLACGFPATRFP